jgi:hypothetical protein
MRKPPRFEGNPVTSDWLGEVGGVAIGVGDVRNSLSPWHVRLAAYAAAQGLHPRNQAVDALDRDTEEDPASGTGSALGVSHEAQFRVTDAEAHIEGRTTSGTRDVCVAASSSV